MSWKTKSWIFSEDIPIVNRVEIWLNTVPLLVKSNLKPFKFNFPVEPSWEIEVYISALKLLPTGLKASNRDKLISIFPSMLLSTV